MWRAGAARYSALPDLRSELLHTFCGKREPVVMISWQFCVLRVFFLLSLASAESVPCVVAQADNRTTAKVAKTDLVMVFARMRLGGVQRPRATLQWQ